MCHAAPVPDPFVHTPLPGVRQITREADEPFCATYQGCKANGMVPRSQARADALASCGGRGNGGSFCPDQNDANALAANSQSSSSDCSVHASIADDGAAPIGLASMFALTAVARFARRRRAAKH